MNREPTPDLDPETLAELSELRKQADQDALRDPGTLAYYLTGKWAFRPHNELVSSELVRLHTGENKRLMVMQPPQTGKSSLLAIWAPFWWLCLHPEHKVIIASYGQQLAVGRGRAIRKLVQEHGWRYGLQIARGSGSVAEWELETGGGVKAVGFGSAVTGFSADLLLIDDPHKNRAEAESLVIRERVWDSYSADLYSRLQPGSPVALLYTPWHIDDLGNRILEQDGRQDDPERPDGQWRLLRMPAFADSEDDPLGRAVGEPLQHPKIPIEDAQAAIDHWDGRRRSTSVRDWHALYMCDPKPAEGALVTKELLRERRHIPPRVTPVKSAVAVDPAGGGRDASGIIGGILGDDQKVYITHDRTLDGYSPDWGPHAALLAAQLKADYLIIEHNYGGEMARTAFRSGWDAVRRMASGNAHDTDDPELVAQCMELDEVPYLVPQIMLMQAKKGKLLRAEPIAQQFWDDRLRLGAYLPALEYEWCTWMPTDPDSPGRIDASCYLDYVLGQVPGADSLLTHVTGVRRQQASRPSARARIQRRPIRPGP